jgi:hypothetical protein
MTLRPHVFATLLAVPSFAGCGGKPSAPAPVISNLVLMVETSGVAAMTVLVSDSAGLDDVTLNVTLTSPSGDEQSSNAPQATSSMAATSGTFLVELGVQGLPAGTYTVAVSATEGGATSNTLTTTMTLQ